MTFLHDASRLGAQDFIGEKQTFESIGSDIVQLPFDRPMRLRWYLAFGLAVALLGVYVISIAWLFFEGVGVWANNIPVTWALDIVSYDWWIGAACGGLFVSSAFLIVGAEFRSALNRLAETLALVSAAAAAVYPIIHLGRPWFFFWNLPYPTSLVLWPQFRSPLYWDAVDIISFLVVSIAFWYIGLIPDLATMRDKAIERIRPRDGHGLVRAQLYGIIALGWRGSAMHWLRWIQAYRLIAIMGVILVVALQTGAAVMFAGTVEPGWHSTLQPVTFLIAAIFEGVGFIAAVIALLRSVFALHTLVTPRHLDALAKMLLVLGILSLYCHMTDIFNTDLHADPYDTAVGHRRMFGPHATAFWTIAIVSLLPVHLFWIPAIRRSALAIFFIGIGVAIGMYADHFMVIVVTLQHDFLPSSSFPYLADIWGMATFSGSVGLFLALILIALRYLPVLSIVETKRLAQVAAGRLP